MPDVAKDLKEKISKKMFQVCAIAFNVTMALDEKRQDSLLSDLDEIVRCCSEASIAFKTMTTTYPIEQHIAKKTDVHTEHCCKICGCKYGDDLKDDDGFIGCSVVSGRAPQTYPCRGDCRF